MGAGKTTAIASISDTPPITTDESASDMTSNRKPNTTVALDYGVMKLPGSENIHLYGTPGQERFDFMWDILTTGGIGLILLINNARPDPFKDLHFFLKAFEDFIKDTHVVIGITRTDEQPKPKVVEYHKQIESLGKKFPVFEVDARNKRDVSLMVEALLYALDPGAACEYA